jgi:hypothetical protein
MSVEESRRRVEELRERREAKERERRHDAAHDARHDAVEDVALNLVAKDRPRDSEGRVLPTMPHYPAPAVPDFTAPQQWPIRPFNENLTAARQYDGDAWNEHDGTSYFADLVAVHEANQRKTGVLRAMLDGGDFMPSPESLVAIGSPGGVEGAVERLSAAALQVERRERAAYEELHREERARRGRPYSLAELRASNITTGSGGVGLTPAGGVPIYVAEMFSDAARTKLALTPRLLQGELPPFGMVVQVGKASTGAAVAVQTAENAAVNDVAMSTSIVTTNIATITGQITLSRQLLDRGLASDAEIAASLGASWAAVLESQVISGSGASGQLLGILNSTPTTSQTYTDAAPTAAKNFSAVQNLIAGTSTAFGAPVDAVVLHTRRAAFIRAGQVVNQALGAAGYGAEVIESEGIPVTLGAGTNQDALIALRLAEVPVFITPPRFELQSGVISGTLQVAITAYSYVALVAARQPAAVGISNGTGLVAPVFP